MITIIGATGFTGSLICQRLRDSKQSLRLAGRDRSRLDALCQKLGVDAQSTIIDVHEKASVQRAISGSSVVINCAGPFTRLGMIVAEECVHAGIHYLDISGEQQFIRLVIEKLGQIAKETLAVAVPACAFEYALADCAAAQLREQLGALETFSSTYIIAGMFTSRGTKRSVLQALESDSHQLRDGKIEKISGGNISPFSFNGKTYQRWPFPGGEVYLVPLHSSPRTVATYLTGEAPPAVMALLSHVMPMIARSPLKTIINGLIDISNPEPDRTNTRFALVCEGTGNGQTAKVTMAGKDPYFLTAVIAAGCALKLAECSGARGGVMSPSMIDGYEFIKTLMERENVSWTCA